MGRNTNWPTIVVRGEGAVAGPSPTEAAPGPRSLDYEKRQGDRASLATWHVASAFRGCLRGGIRQWDCGLENLVTGVGSLSVTRILAERKCAGDCIGAGRGPVRAPGPSACYSELGLRVAERGKDYE